MDKNLYNYIKRESSKGFTLDQIKSTLMKVGYPEAMIDEHSAIAYEHKEGHKYVLVFVIFLIIVIISTFFFFYNNHVDVLITFDWMENMIRQ